LAEGSNRKYESTVIARALKGEEIRDEYDNFLNRSWISNAFPIKNKCGEIIGAISIGHDITEYELLRKEILRLDRLNIVGQMAASVAHEVRNPMTVARGYIQRLLMKTGDTYSTQFNTVIEELDRANNIINNFLSLARNKYVEKRDESLGKIISDIYPLIESEALERNMNCRMILQENLPKLLLNTEEMKQLILNLSMNALDAMDEHGELVLSCEFQQGAGEVILSVSDTGCGIDADNLAMVFDPFYTTKKAGSGLGLPVCKSIVERHGAAICVHSEPGKGTVFAVRFPVEKSEQSI
jgi:two-component system, sporulation sensor kinase E